MRNLALRLSSAALALAVFLVDVLTPLTGAVAVLYIVAILLAAETSRRIDIVVAAASCVALTITAYLFSHGWNSVLFSHDLTSVASTDLRALVSLAAIAITTLLALRNHAATNHLAESERRYRRMFDASRIGVVEEDWTEIRTALKSLNVSEVDLRDYLIGHPDFIRRARALSRLTAVNPALQRMVGAGGSADFTNNLDKFLGEGDQTFLGSLVAFAVGEPFHEGETELVGLGGRKVPALFTITFPAEDDRNVLAFVVDITERKQAQDALLAAQTELAHAARVATLGELTASIAHEVNQPLMAIVTSGEAGLRWLRRDVPNLEEVAAAIARVVAEGRRASEIVTRIRAFLKKRPAQQDMLQIAGIIEEAALLVDHELSKDDIILAIEAEPGLPPFRGDRIQIQQVLVNLIVNASQAMSKQAGPRIVTVRAGLAETGMLGLTVKDTGPGIAPQDLPRLFEPFFSTKHGGMGMGLAICRTTVEAHGGELSAESTPGSGATFRLTLPTIEHPGSQ